MSTQEEIARQVETHTIDYRILNQGRADSHRPLTVEATVDEIAAFTRDGFLVRERLFDAGHTARLRTALDEVAQRETEGGANSVNVSAQFGGLFLRHLMDKHEAFLELFRFQPTLSIARAMLGPQVQLLPLTARISYPSEYRQQTHWHFHQRVIPDPLPPFFCRPHVIDCLIYLDNVTEENGPLLVLPGTHDRIHNNLPADDWADKPGQIKLTPPAGSVVMIHGATWHRAMPTTPLGSKRRLLILPYGAAWLKLPTFGTRPPDGLMQRLYENADGETLELLGEPEGLY